MILLREEMTIFPGMLLIDDYADGHGLICSVWLRWGCDVR